MQVPGSFFCGLGRIVSGLCNHQCVIYLLPEQHSQPLFLLSITAWGLKDGPPRIYSTSYLRLTEPMASYSHRFESTCLADVIEDYCFGASLVRRSCNDHHLSGGLRLSLVFSVTACTACFHRNGYGSPWQLRRFDSYGQPSYSDGVLLLMSVDPSERSLLSGSGWTTLTEYPVAETAWSWRPSVVGWRVECIWVGRIRSHLERPKSFLWIGLVAYGALGTNGILFTICSDRWLVPSLVLVVKDRFHLIWYWTLLDL